MTSLLDHLITDPNGKVTADWARTIHAELAKLPRSVRNARKLELAATAPKTKPQAERAAPTVGTGVVDETLAAWWEASREAFGSTTAAIREAAKTFPETSRADFIATLVAAGVNQSTAGVQFKKGRDGL